MIFSARTGDESQLRQHFKSPKLMNRPNLNIHDTPHEPELQDCLMDYFPFDSWVKYSYPDGSWIWSAKELPLVTFGDHQVLAKLTKAPENTNKLYAMVYNNVWEVNFLVDQPGVEEFNFYMVWKDKSFEDKNIDEHVQTTQSEPVVFMNPPTRENPIILNRIYKP